MVELAPVRVLIVGMMGSGKTTVGRRLAVRTGWPYIDNDELVERATGRTARELLQAGVTELRRSESAALTEALDVRPPVVAGVPGGVVDDPSDRERLRRGGFVVWLRASIETLLDRLGEDVERPWLQPDPEAALHQLYVGRERKYAQVATLVLDVDHASPDELVDGIVAALRVVPADSTRAGGGRGSQEGG